MSAASDVYKRQAIWWWMLYTALRKVTCTNIRKNMYVVTPRCAAAAVASAVVLQRPTKEYTHMYSMMHRRLTTAGIEVAPHYHQLLVMSCLLRITTALCAGSVYHVLH